MSRGDRRRWVAKVRADPKGTLEADLAVAVIGVVFAVGGGLTSVAGVHPAWQDIHDNAPAPIYGSIVFTAGLYVTAIGLILLVTNVFVWVTGRRKLPEVEPETRHDVVACSICGECKPMGKGVLVALGFCAGAVALGGAAAATGGSAAIWLGGLALLVFVTGAWTLTITGGMLLLVHWSGRRERREQRRRPRRPNARQRPPRPHRRA